MKLSVNILLALCSLLCITLGISQHSADSKVSESLKKIFGDSITVSVPQVIRLTPEEQKRLSEQTKTLKANDSVVVYVCSSHDQEIGYGFVDNVKGKTQFITYLTAITPNGTVADIDVLVYRESYGGEIAYESFRKQFRDKTINDKLIPGRDIKNISGATISVRAITEGVKKNLKLFDIIKTRL